MANPVPPIAVNGQYPFLSPISFSNGGTAGGTFYYVQLGAVKMLWGNSGTFTVGANTGATGGLTLPTGFFTNIRSAQATATTMTLQLFQYANITTTLPVTGSPSTITLEAVNPTGTASVTQVVSVLLIGD